MRIAINVADLTRHPHHNIAPLLMGPVTPNRILVNANPSVLDEGAVVLECDEKRARSIAQVFRNADERMGQYKTRVYFEGGRGGWRKATNKEIIMPQAAGQGEAANIMAKRKPKGAPPAKPGKGKPAGGEEEAEEGQDAPGEEE